MAKASVQQEFVQLIAQHQKLIHSLCSLYYRLPEDRKDLFQEIVLQLWKSYPSFNHQSKVSTWIYRVALNTVLPASGRKKHGLRMCLFRSGNFNFRRWKLTMN